MKFINMKCRLICALWAFQLVLSFGVAAQDPLPSWNEGVLKTAIIRYVGDITRQGSTTFIPEADRIATFDNDGTLWAEKPLVEGLFILHIAGIQAKKNPSLQNRQPYKAILAHDTSFLNHLTERDLIGLFISTHSGLTASEFRAAAEAFFASAKTPAGVPIASLVYKPQLELLRYLENNGFKNFICTGGDVDFVRVISQKYYNIPPERVMGSSLVYTFRDSAGVNDVYRLPKVGTINDKQGKPTTIQLQIGKRPVLACGNEGGGGDIYMLRFSQGNSYPSLQLIVNHDDKEREFAYEEKDNKSLNWAKKYKWNVISMKNDWNTIFNP